MMNNNHGIECIKIFRGGVEYTITPNTISYTVMQEPGIYPMTDIREPDIYTITQDTKKLDKDLDWLIARYDLLYNDFLNRLQNTIARVEGWRYAGHHWDCHALTKPIFKLIKDNYTKHVDIGIMYYNLIRFLQRQLEKLQAEYCAINSQGKKKKHSFIIKMQNIVVDIIATYKAVKDAMSMANYNYYYENVVKIPKIPEIEQSIKNAKKLEENLMQFLKGEKNNDDTPHVE